MTNIKTDERGRSPSESRLKTRNYLKFWFLKTGRESRLDFGSLCSERWVYSLRLPFSLQVCTRSIKFGVQDMSSSPDSVSHHLILSKYFQIFDAMLFFPIQWGDERKSLRSLLVVSLPGSNSIKTKHIYLVCLHYWSSVIHMKKAINWTYI